MLYSNPCIACFSGAEPTAMLQWLKGGPQYQRGFGDDRPQAQAVFAHQQALHFALRVVLHLQ